MSIPSAHKKLAVDFFVSPFVPAILAGLAPIAGAWIAFRHDYIAHIFNSESPVLAGALLDGWGDLIIFVCCIVLLIFGFTLHKWAEATRNKERIDELGDHTKALKLLLETLPPQGFLEKYRDFFERSYSVIVAGLGDKTKAKDSIKVILCNLALLASYFDDQSTPSQYSINFMVFEHFPLKDRVRAQQLLEKLKFAEGPLSESSLAGVLTINTELAFTMKESTHELAIGVPQLILPVPSQELRVDSGRSTVLPGAPAAFCENKAQYCDDTAELGKSMGQTGLRPSIAKRIDTYFREEGSSIKSFISLPMTMSINTVEEQIGVVNIHSNRSRMLRGVKGVQLFIPLATPYCIFLAQLIKEIEPPKLITDSKATV